MLRYETLILTIPEITNDESKAIETEIEKAIKQTKGSVISYDRWGKYRLAYPVKKNDYGVYYLARYEVPTEGKAEFFDSLKSLFTIKHEDVVMRDMTSVLSANGSLEYERPESLEETPKDVESFLRENKMEGLISSTDSKEAPLKEAAPVEETVVEDVVEKVEPVTEKAEDGEKN